jgi:hypothetical protein
MKAEIKIRKTWSRNPVQRPHSSPKGKRAYSRRDNKRIARESY